MAEVLPESIPLVLRHWVETEPLLQVQETLISCLVEGPGKLTGEVGEFARAWRWLVRWERSARRAADRIAGVASIDDPDGLESFRTFLTWIGLAALGAEPLRHPRDAMLDITDSFVWPEMGDEGLASILPCSTGMRAQGFLGFSGYRCGKSSPLADESRRQVLEEVFLRVEVIDPARFGHDWGVAGSGARLLRIAIALVAQARFERGRRFHEDSFRQRLDDLGWLKSTFYDGRFDQAWPWPWDAELEGEE